MLYVDQRIGSGELAKYLGILHLPIEVTQLSAGDFSFLGLGPEGMPVPVGIERKALDDFITSHRTGRITEQFRKMVLCFEERWIVLEGLWRVDDQTGLIQTLFPPKGVKKTKKYQWFPLEVGGQQVTYRELEGMVITSEVKAGVRIRRTTAKYETARFILALYHWWTDKAFEQHRSHLQLNSLQVDSALLVKPSVCRMVAAQLPGIGWTRSRDVALYFKTVRAMVQASEKEWQEVKGIGKGTAKKVMDAMETP